ncbi:MAG: M1 family metallopeptidase [Chloroflexi bacterium]|nr:M1 family metallopeptidase [Chloroflexota bacterium]
MKTRSLWSRARVCLTILAFVLWGTACQLPTPPIVYTPIPPAPTPTSPPPPPQSLSLDDLTLFEQAMIPIARGDVAQVATVLRPTRYRIDARFDPTSRTISGQEIVRYTNNEAGPLDAVYFRLFPNLPRSGRATVSSLTVDGASVTPQRELAGSALRVPMDPPLPPGASVTFQLDFTVQAPATPGGNYGAFAYTNEVVALAGFYPLIPVFDDEGWNVEIAPAYGDPVYSDTSFYLVRFTLPTGWEVAASGSTLGVEDNGDGTTTWTIVSGPMRDFNLAASPAYRTMEMQVDDTVVRSHFKPGDEAGGRRALEYTAHALRYFNEIFGIYPFAELDVAATPTTAGGIEYPGLIVIAERLYGEKGGFFEWATVHETAHQWWYSLVGNDQVDDPWLDEALTQYVTWMYVEATYGKVAAAIARRAFFDEPYRRLVEEGKDPPIGLPVRAYSEEDYGPVVYAKGPLFFHELRQTMGDATFRAFLRTYFERYRYRIATPEDLLTVAQETCRCDLTPIYARWVLGITLGEPPTRGRISSQTVNASPSLRTPSLPPHDRRARTSPSPPGHGEGDQDGNDEETSNSVRHHHGFAVAVRHRLREGVRPVGHGRHPRGDHRP